jgi:hypothetical protein
LSNISAGAAVTSTLTLDEVTAGADVGVVDRRERQPGARYHQTGGNLSGDIDVAGAIAQVDLVGDLAAGGLIQAGTTLGPVDIDGNLSGTVSSAGAITTLDVGLDVERRGDLGRGDHDAAGR